MKIYSSQISPRLDYTLNVVFKHILKVDYVITNNQKDLSLEEVFINYSDQKIAGGIQILPAQLLFEKDIREQEVDTGKYKDLTVLYFNNKGDVPYDLFSSVFYMISRYEEYLPFQGDEYGRFKAENSIAFINNFHALPIVELWIKQLADILKIDFPTTDYKQLLTIDIDNAWTYKNKGFLNTCGGLFFKALQFNFKEVGKRIKVLTGKQKDPGDNYKFLDIVQEKMQQPIQYFILVGKNRKYDNAHSVSNKNYHKLLRKLHANNKLGLHPSFQSNSSYNILHKEYLKLCAVHIQKVTKSRQHYLILKFPETYKNIINLSIREDYSLGWSSQVGFRAGISRPFPFFNLKENKHTHLMLIPFAVMDRTIKDYLELSPKQALIQLKEMVDQVKEVGGQYTMLWHNDSLSDEGEWKGWRTVFEQLIEYAE